MDSTRRGRGRRAALLQGLGVFAVWGFAGSFFSPTGAECVAIPVGIESWCSS